MTVAIASDSKATSVMVSTSPAVSRRRPGAHTPSAPGAAPGVALASAGGPATDAYGPGGSVVTSACSRQNPVRHDRDSGQIVAPEESIPGPRPGDRVHEIEDRAGPPSHGSVPGVSPTWSATTVRVHGRDVARRVGRQCPAAGVRVRQVGRRAL